MTRPVLRLRHVLRQDLDSEVVDMKLVEKIKALFRPRWIYRDAGSGEFLSKEEAAKRPRDTWIRQRILFPRGGHHR